MRLSFLIPTMPVRAPKLGELLAVLLPQMTDETEILLDCRSGPQLGAKRNDLLARATGDYTVMIDDDDLVATDYVSRVLQALKSDPDYVGYRIQLTVNGTPVKPTFHSIRYSHWYEDEHGYYRHVEQKNPVRRSIAMSAPYPEITTGEDRVWSEAIHHLVQTEEYIDDVMYFYRFSPEGTLTQ